MNELAKKLKLGLKSADSILPEIGRIARLVQKSGSSIGYCGFVGQGNAGDDAMLLAHQRQFNSIAIRPVPITFSSVLFPALEKLPISLGLGLMVGGGTLVGRPEWLKRMSTSHTAIGGPLVFTGVGVEDPEFIGSKGSSTSIAHLKEWAPFLASAEHLTVRGPRSAAILESVGVHADVVSDPALMLGPDSPDFGAVRPKRLGINVAKVEDQYQGSSSNLLDESVRACEKLVTDGWEVTLLSFEHGDFEIATEIERRVSGVVANVGFRDVDELCRQISFCDVVVGQRLHCIVLAAAFAVPSVSLDYRPKCRDFLNSLGREAITLPSHTATADEIVEAVVHLHESRDRESTELLAAVQKARQVLRAQDQRVEEIFAAHLDMAR